MQLEYPSSLSAVHFIRLKLTRGGETVSQNFYWRGLEKGNYRALRDLPKVKLEASTRTEQHGDRWLLVTELRNPSAHPALMVRLKAVREKTGDRILPAIYTRQLHRPDARRIARHPNRVGKRRHPRRAPHNGHRRIQHPGRCGELSRNDRYEHVRQRVTSTATAAPYKRGERPERTHVGNVQ